MGYDNDKGGQRLAQVDNDALVRGLIRSKVLDSKNNGGYNILTGETRMQVTVPVHDKYNPTMHAPSSVRSRMSNTGQAIIGAPNLYLNRSKHSNAATNPITGSQRASLPPASTQAAASAAARSA